MANFRAYSQFDIFSINFNWYYQNLGKLGLAEDANIVIDGVTYPDAVAIQGKSGSTNLELDFLGRNVTLDGLGNINGGIANFIAEFDLNTNAVRWALSGIQADAESLYDSFGTVANQDELSILIGSLGGNDEIILSQFDDRMNAGFGDDVIAGGGGNDFIDAGAGSDVGYYVGSRSEYTISYDSLNERFTVTDLVAGRDGVDTLRSVEFLSFEDQLFDLSNIVFNKSPVFSVPSQSVVTEEETPVIVIAKATDGNGDPITYSISNPPRSGTVTGSDGVYTYVPADGFNGTDFFTIAANDGRGGITSQTVTVSISSVNDAPVNQVPGPLQTNEDVNLAFGPSENRLSVIDLDSSNVTVTLSVTHGVLTVGNTTQLAVVTGKDTSVMTISGNVGVVSGVLFNSGLRFIPDADFSGTALLTMVSNDGPGGMGGRSDTDFVTITVNAVNDAPGFSDIQNVSAPTGKSVQISAIAFDPDDTNLTYTTSAAAHGTVSGGAGGTFSYKAVQGYLGADSFKITVSDGHGGTTVQTVNVEVTPVPASESNSAPVTDVEDPFENVEDDLLIVRVPQGVLAGDSDVDGGTLNAVLVSATSNGRLTLSLDGSFTYMPNANFNGTDSFTYKARDSAGALSSARIVTINVAARNDDPHAVDDSFVTKYQTPLVTPIATLLANDTDIDSTKLTISSVQGPVNGNVSLNAGVVTFTPNAGYSGAAGYSYTVSDGNGGTDEAMVSLTVGAKPANSAPHAVDDSLLTAFQTALVTSTATLLANDTDIDGDVLNIQSVQGAVNGTVGMGPGTITFTPKAGYSGVASYSYTISDNNGGISEAKVTVMIAAMGDPPVIANAIPDQSSNEDFNWTYQVPANSFLDVAGNVISYSAARVDGSALPSWLTFTASTRTFSGKPPPDFNGSLDLKVTASHGSASASDTFTLTVTPLNDPPSVASSQNVTTVQGLARQVIVAGADVDGDTLDYGFLPPGQGIVTGGAGGVFTYTPNPGYTGPDSFLVIVYDGHGETAQQTVNVTVIAVNDPPVNIVPAAQTTNEDSLKVITGLSISDEDAGTGALTVTLAVDHGKITLGAASGAATIANNSSASVTITGSLTDINATLAAASAVTYTPIPNYSGADTLHVTTNDNGNTGAGGALTDIDSVAITVVAVNDAPVNTVPAAQTINQGVAKVIAGLSISDVDAGNGPLTVTLAVDHGRIALGPASGGASIAGNNSASVTLTGSLAAINATLGAANAVTYTPSLGYSGADTLHFTTSDNGNSGSGSALVDTDSVDLLPSTSVAQIHAGESVGMSGRWNVFGDSGSQTITVGDHSLVTFRSGFNAGAMDSLRLTGQATDFSISASGSNAVLTSLVDDMTATVPIGLNGIKIIFDNDVTRTIAFVNGPSFDVSPPQIVAGASNVGTISSTSAVGQVHAGESAGVSGRWNIFGDSGSETITVGDHSNITFRSGFNAGATDSLHLTGLSTNFNLPTLSGSNAVLTSSIEDISLTFPVGLNGINIMFEDNVTRTIAVIDGLVAMTTLGIPGSVIIG